MGLYADMVVDSCPHHQIAIVPIVPLEIIQTGRRTFFLSINDGLGILHSMYRIASLRLCENGES